MKSKVIGQMCSQKFPLLVYGCCVAALGLFYKVFFDLFLIFALFLSSYCAGSFFRVHGGAVQKALVRTAIGLGIIGIAVYFILLAGVGSTAVYAFLLLLPVVLRGKALVQLRGKIRMLNFFMKRHFPAFLVLLFLLLFYLACACSPIGQYDALTKHVPLTLYAARTGKWYTDVVESIVYGECMLLQYTYSAMFASFGAYKGWILFNVAIFFLIFLALAIFIHNLHRKTNLMFFAVLYFTTPMYFLLSTEFSLDVLPLYFLFHAVLCFSSLRPRTAWENLPVVAFLFGCSLFAKLTISYTILTVGIIELVFCFRYLPKYQGKRLAVVWRLLFSFLLFLFPFVPSVAVMWHRNGNPFIFFFNDFFKGPYFPAAAFTDPFQSSPLGLNLQALMKIVFHTSQNIEMGDGALGIWLLLCILIPAAMIFSRSKKIIVWGAVPFLAFLLSCRFTYNLRYSLSIFTLFLALIVCSFYVILDWIFDRVASHAAPHDVGKKRRGPVKKNFRKKDQAASPNKYLPLRGGIALVVCAVLVIPNIYFFRHLGIPSLLRPSVKVTSNLNDEILKEIPTGKRVFSVNDPFKGEYNGFFSPWMWHNSYAVSKVTSGEWKLSDYVSSFDYVLYRKDQKMDIPNQQITDMIQSAGKTGSLLSPYAETDHYILYRVNQESNIVQQENFLAPKASRTSEPQTFTIKQKKDGFIISQDVENPSSESVRMRFQINWYGEGDAFLSTNISEYELKPGRTVETSQPILMPEKAKYGILYITTADDKKVLVHGYCLKGYASKSLLDKEIEKYNMRARLWKR